jgi:hypothetical protein
MTYTTETILSNLNLPKSGLLNKRQAAECLGYSVSWLNKAIARSAISYIKDTGSNSKVLFHPRAIADYIVKHQIKATA